MLWDGISNAVILKRECFQPHSGNGADIFSNPPTATVPHTAMSNRLIGLLHKRGEIKKNVEWEGDVKMEGGREGGRRMARG